MSQSLFTELLQIAKKKGFLRKRPLRDCEAGGNLSIVLVSVHIIGRGNLVNEFTKPARDQALCSESCNSVLRPKLCILVQNPALGTNLCT